MIFKLTEVVLINLPHNLRKRSSDDVPGRQNLDYWISAMELPMMCVVTVADGQELEFELRFPLNSMKGY